uniref:Restriction endonuclease n=1 Tax=Candidatus Kentrum sp. TC TaxID=2126339 RepID=A0A450YNL1_9GAMM|nr:MAG: hypothetical protein BECKTC1821E_GA0114239_10232 [Candidatus Kentron sp. TC]
MKPEQFEALLDGVVISLSRAAQSGEEGFANSKDFEKTVLAALQAAIKQGGIASDADRSWHPHAFPDLSVNGFGVEVKHTTKDSWLAVGNSIFEGMRDESAQKVYVIFGKMGGWPEARWARYEDCITHVRISHAPRFVVEMDRESPLFSVMDIAYDDFRRMSPEDKMHHIREYSRNRLRPGERLWWLEDREIQSHALPMQVRLYMALEQDEKRKYRAEAAILNPQICKPSRARGKYNDAALYLLTRHGIFCPQTRDLFSAGSVAGKERGGNYLLRALQDIQDLMRNAARELDAELFVEYWGEECPVDQRIARWLEIADGYAKDWYPSEHLFLDGE